MSGGFGFPDFGRFSITPPQLAVPDMPCQECHERPARLPIKKQTSSEMGPFTMLNIELLWVCNKCHHEMELEKVAESLR